VYPNFPSRPTLYPRCLQPASTGHHLLSSFLHLAPPTCLHRPSTQQPAPEVRHLNPNPLTSLPPTCRRTGHQPAPEVRHLDCQHPETAWEEC
jgi:hypothetical protein